MVVPPALAPVQVVIRPDLQDRRRGEGALRRCSRIAAELTKIGVRAKADLRDNLRPGNKFFEWEKKACRCAWRSVRATWPRASSR